MKQLARHLWRTTSGTTSAEFALVLPLLLVMLFGIIDAGRFMWQYNQAEKAAMMGARYAVVTSPIAPGMFAYKFTSGGLGAGDTIPAGSFGTVSCTSSACTCAATPCPTGTGAPATGTFTPLVNWMNKFDPEITATNVKVEYQGSGLGYAGNPTGMDLVPIVTVKLTGLQFTPITTLAFLTLTMPDFHTSLTAEDSIGAKSN